MWCVEGSVSVVVGGRNAPLKERGYSRVQGEGTQSYRRENRQLS